ncbi:MAG TPA: polyhydroxyalkanoic acid system family protein [Xanthobacteraceae bacterium]|jgi:hypothetical protein|nr:polyhydroxyalkanoic acid system family protein [Xanthobacteraceae bacterium]
MTKPLVVTISHQLGREEAQRRIQNGLAQVKEKYASFVTLDEDAWDGNQLDVRVRAIGQNAAARIDVMDDHLRLEVTLPWLLAKVAEKIVPTIQREGTLLIEKK